MIGMTISSLPYSLKNKPYKNDIGVFTCPHKVLELCKVSRQWDSFWSCSGRVEKRWFLGGKCILWTWARIIFWKLQMTSTHQYHMHIFWCIYIEVIVKLQGQYGFIFLRVVPLARIPTTKFAIKCGVFTERNNKPHLVGKALITRKSRWIFLINKYFFWKEGGIFKH